MAVGSGAGASFRPAAAIGGAVDGQDAGVVDQMYTAKNLSEMRSAGLGALSYRLRTELGDEAWHWNPAGTWSDPAHQSGYWTSSATPAQPIQLSFGYRLPRRGNTVDQANNDGYSRLDDADAASFWKSNPYLDPHFTGEPADAHPQWVVVDLGKTQQVDAVRLQWGVPFAVTYRVQYWDGEDPFSVGAGSKEQWRDFPAGAVANGAGGDVTVDVDPSGNTQARFVRVLMTQGSGTAPAGSTDPRDAAGFALREIQVGTKDADARLHDVVRHGASAHAQSPVYVSSTDPWHRATDRDPRTEQPGFDRILASGLLSGQPAMVPVPLLFSTPADAVAELQYLRTRGFPVGRVELGEEPDGQNVLPEDFGALYLQWARALHAIDPSLAIGGPSFQTGFEEVDVWADAAGDTSWLRRFLGYLAGRGAADQFSFLSVEWYPFDDPCSPEGPNLASEPRLLRDAFKSWASQGVPASMPKIVTEYGYSPEAAEPEVDLGGALLNADFAAQFLTMGGTATYLYGYEPNVLDHSPPCTGWGNNMLFKGDDNYQANDELATYWAARMLSQDWAQPGDGLHQVYEATFAAQGGGPAPVTAYAVHRPDGQWAVLVLNKDASRTWDLTVSFDAGGRRVAFGPSLKLFQFGPAQYQWRPNGDHGQTGSSEPPAERTVLADRPLVAPPSSISVLVGTGP
ncbi:MAG: discoidin domain-containing protein [Acidimicrobiia bacterium]|nr:discoidin domain-containing protein [Acidimicrobiia bacterium]